MGSTRIRHFNGSKEGDREGKIRFISKAGANAIDY
jgi:hypothetical protein